MPMTLEELLADHTDAVADVARRLIDHVGAAAEWSKTSVYPGWHGVGFHHAQAGYVVGVFPRVDDVRVLFEHGHALGDADYLEGSGQTRFITFTAPDPARLAVVDDLIDRALG